MGSPLPSQQFDPAIRLGLEDYFPLITYNWLYFTVYFNLREDILNRKDQKQINKEIGLIWNGTVQ